MKNILIAIALIVSSQAIHAVDDLTNIPVTPTQYMGQFLMPLLPESLDDFVNALHPDRPYQTNVVYDHTLPGGLKRDLTDVEYAQYMQKIKSGEEIEQNMIAAQFHISIQNEHLVVESTIDALKPLPLDQSKNWEEVKEKLASIKTDREGIQKDGCSVCEYKYRVIVNDVCKKIYLHTNTKCITTW